MVLRSDTAVTNHGYADGRFFAYPAVLQADTAVFVNSYGEPKAKCFSGNPLTQPVSNPQASYVGPTWEQFAPTSVTIIQQPPTVINNYTFVDVHKGTTVRRRAKPPQHNDNNWHCKDRNSHQCNGGTGGSGQSGDELKPKPDPNSGGPDGSGDELKPDPKPDSGGPDSG